jgi:TIR domain
MDIFITWSGPRSLAVAEALKEYLPMMVNAFKPWLSRGIDKGANWSTELTSALNSARAGIICLTPSNLAEPWILFEAGAIAKQVTEKPLACTLLIDLKSSDLSGPLTLFQDTKATRDDLLHLVKTLNNAAGEGRLEEARVEKAFGLVWPKLKESLENLPGDGAAGRPPEKPTREMLEEILDSVRGKNAIDAALLVEAQRKITELTLRLARAERSLAQERERAGLIDLERRIVGAGGDWAAAVAGLSGEPLQRAARRAADAAAEAGSSATARLRSILEAGQDAEAKADEKGGEGRKKKL